MPIEASTEAELIEALAAPYPEDVALARRLEGDVLVLGAGGKMGPTLVGRIARAFAEAGRTNQVLAVSRFSDAVARREVESAGGVAIAADLLDERALADLPDCPNVIYLVGMKFGASGQLPRTWAMNTYLPGRVAERFKESRIVALSTGNIYGAVAPESGGSKEGDEPHPVGEYAQSCLGRERMLQFMSERHETPVCILRLNYAVEARYGVLLDVAQRVYRHEPVSLSMGYANVIWQGDANSVCFRALEHCAAPPEILNLTGPEILSVRELALKFGEHFRVEPVLEGDEEPTALLSDASRGHQLFGTPRVAPSEVVDLVASWVTRGGATHGKPTKFDVRDGRF